LRPEENDLQHDQADHQAGDAPEAAEGVDAAEHGREKS